MIDYGFEDRLIERIALRETIATVSLTAKEKRVLHYHLRGQTFGEIAKDEGLSRTRIDQIFQQSVWKLRRRIRATEARFDKAAFLQHMRGLAAQEAAYEQRRFEAERDELERMLARERAPLPPPPPVRKWNAIEEPGELPRPPVDDVHIPDWLLDRLWEAGEYLQVYRYMVKRVSEQWRYKHTEYGTFEPDRS